MRTGKRILSLFLALVLMAGLSTMALATNTGGVIDPGEGAFGEFDDENYGGGGGYLPPVEPQESYIDCPRDQTCPAYKFTDLNLSLWYHDCIHYCVEKGLMNGIGNNLFDPTGNLSRAMMVQVLYNMEGRPAYTTDKSFDDVASGQWYYDAVLWAAENDIVNGYPGNVYGPNDDITREQMAAILYRYAQFKGIDVSAQGDLSKFTDGDSVSSWAVEEMQWAVAVGLMQGYNNMLEPLDTATRAEVAQVFLNYCTKIIKK